MKDDRTVGRSDGRTAPVLALPPAGYHFDEWAMRFRLRNASDAECESIYEEHFRVACRYTARLTAYAGQTHAGSMLAGFNGATEALNADMAGRWLCARWKRRDAAARRRSTKPTKDRAAA
jgi:hypothetical protein